MKKTLILNLIDGRKIERDITNTKVAPFGAPANDEDYAKLCMFLATNGTTDTENIGPKHMVYIAPASIKSIEILFS